MQYKGGSSLRLEPHGSRCEFAARRDLRSADVFRPEEDQDARRADLERLLAADRGSMSWDDEVCLLLLANTLSGAHSCSP